MNKTLMPAMVNGSPTLNITGIKQTPLFMFITSSEGLSQLGINFEDAVKLLDAYRKTFKVRRSGNSISFEFGDNTKLMQLTPHPYAGVGKLNVQSWFEFVKSDGGLGGKTISDAGFVPRNVVASQSPKAAERIRLAAPLGGLMLPRGTLGSPGKWRIPPGLSDFDAEWLDANKVQIENAVLNAARGFLLEEIKKRAS